MPMTDFDDLMVQKGSSALIARSKDPSVVGIPIQPSEIRSRLSERLYLQLSNGDDATVVRAAERASIHLSAIFGRLGRTVSLDLPIDREIAVLFTIYEMHVSLGMYEAGKECRVKAKDLIVATYGDFPEAEKPLADKVAAGAITVSARRPFP